MVYRLRGLESANGALNRFSADTSELESHLGDFSVWLGNLGRSPATVRTYRSVLGAYLRWADRQEASPAQSWLRWKASPQTRRLTGIALRVFGKFLCEFGLLPESYFIPRGLPPATKPQPKPIDFKTVLAILTGSRRVVPVASGRSFRAWILLIWEAGIRRSEAANVEWSDMDLGQNPSVHVIGKGGRERSIPMSGRLARALICLRKGGGKYPWTGCRGQRLGGHDLARMFRQSCVAAGVAGMKIHHLRHARLTRLAAVTGVDAITFCSISGHADLRSAAYYVRPNPDKIRTALSLSRSSKLSAR